MDQVEPKFEAPRASQIVRSPASLFENARGHAASSLHLAVPPLAEYSSFSKDPTAPQQTQNTRLP